MIKLISFPNRVWEPTGTGPRGEFLWSSRPVTKEDRDRRAKLLVEDFHIDKTVAQAIVGRDVSDDRVDTSTRVQRLFHGMNEMDRQDLLQRLRQMENE